jgi:transposase-like protein
MDREIAEKLASELRGRRWSEADGRRVVAAWKASGESVFAFAARVGLDAPRVYWWRTHLAKRGGKAASAGKRDTHHRVLAPLVPVTICESTIAGQVTTRGCPSVVVEATGGLRIEVSEVSSTTAAWVAALVSSLRRVQP